MSASSRLPREKAIHKADLPHAFEGRISVGCDVCGEPVFEARHLAWEKAHEAQPAPVIFPRETGV
ncbi:MAG: hypothetical protein H0X35_09505 [Pseudonocardiales bacterium]|nr:hypothetical protein [Pseudonocardiales bacterium]